MSDITLTKEDVVKELKNIRATLYHSQAKTKNRRNFKELRANDQLLTEQSWQRQLICLDMAVSAVYQTQMVHFHGKRP